MARSPRCGRSTAPSMRCSARSCCARAATRSSKAAPGRACSIRSSAARRRAPRRSTFAIMRRWCAKPMRSFPAAARRSRTSLPATWKRRPRRSTSSAPPSIATAWPRCRRSNRIRASIRAASRRPMFLPCISRAASPASKCSSSAPARTGATAPIFPRPTARSGPGEVLSAFLAQFYDDKPPPRLILISHAIEDRALLAEALSTKSGHKIEVSLPQRGEKKDLIEHALANAREALGRKLAETSSQQKLLRSACRDFRPAACRRGASRFTTTATSRAPTRSAP